MNSHKRNFFLYLILGLVATVFCIKQIGEPDVWWQIRTGQYILEHGSVPQQDVFSYTHAGVEWVNVKWGTEVLMALISNILGPEWLMLFTWLLLLGIILFTLSSFLILFKGSNTSETVNFSWPVFAFFLLIIGLSFRINGRPEVVSYFFTSLYLFLFIRYHHKPDYWIFALIPLQCLWANMHEAYGVGVVMMGVFLLENVYRYVTKKTSKRVFTTQIGAVLLAFLAPSIHPFGVQMIWHPYNIFTQLGDNKFTSELLSITADGYFNVAAGIMLVMFICIVLFFFRSRKEFKAIPITLLLLLMAFIFLALKAQRNIPFFLIAASPLVALLLVRFKASRAVYFISILSGVGIYLAVVSGAFYHKFLPKEKYGLRVDPKRSVIGAANYINKHVESQKAFADYLSSSYFLWAVPDFKTFVDLRDLDIFPSDFMGNVIRLYQYPTNPVNGKAIWDLVAEDDGFTYVALLNRQDFFPLHQYLNKNESWALAYADPNLSIYLKNSALLQAQYNEALNTDFDKKFHPYGELQTSSSAKVISKLFWPFYQEEDMSKLNYIKVKSYLKAAFQ